MSDQILSIKYSGLARNEPLHRKCHVRVPLTPAKVLDSSKKIDIEYITHVYFRAVITDTEIRVWLKPNGELVGYHKPDYLVFAGKVVPREDQQINPDELLEQVLNEVFSKDTEVEYFRIEA